MAKPVFLVSVFIVKPVFVAGIGLRMFQKKYRVYQFFFSLENEFV